MLAIPAIDIYKGKVTRLLKGDFEKQKFYEKSPLEYAISFSSVGLQWIHIVDLEASVTGCITVAEQIEKIKSSTNLMIQFGGGIKNFANAEKIFSIGTDRIMIGSISVTNKKEFERIVEHYGNEKIVVALDVSNEVVYLKGWTEKSEVSLWNHLEYCCTVGIKYVLCTDISKDGTLAGPNILLYQKMMENYSNVKIIASGGVSNIDDLYRLKNLGIYASVIGKAFYENKISLEEFKQFVS